MNPINSIRFNFHHLFENISSKYLKHKPFIINSLFPLIVASVGGGILLYKKWKNRTIVHLNKKHLNPREIDFLGIKITMPVYNKKLNTDSIARENQTLEYKTSYNSIAKEKQSSERTTKDENGNPLQKISLMGFINWIPGEFGLWMPGVALIASYLQHKHNLKGLFVCDTVEAFQDKIAEIANSQSDARVALIIPVVDSDMAKHDMANHRSSITPNFPQHKVTVVIEKLDSNMKIALLDSSTDLPTDKYGNAYVITPGALELGSIWEGQGFVKGRYTAFFNRFELVFRAILKGTERAKIKPNLYYSTVHREVHYGCAVYALRDAVAFLRELQFFEKITTAPSKKKKPDGYSLEEITILPVSHYITSQRSGPINQFFEIHPEESDQKMPHKNKTLHEYLDENRVTSGGKSQNHYITRKMYQYYEMVIQAAEKMPEEKLMDAIDQTLLTKQPESNS